MIARTTLLWYGTTAEPLWWPCTYSGYHSCSCYGWDYGTYADDACFDFHDYDDDTDDDADDDDDDDTEDDTDDGANDDTDDVADDTCVLAKLPAAVKIILEPIMSGPQGAIGSMWKSNINVSVASWRVRIIDMNCLNWTKLDWVELTELS